MTEAQITPDDEMSELDAMAAKVRDTAAEPEAIQPISKMTILPGRILKDNEIHSGEPAAYFVRTEGTTDTRQLTPGSLESMMVELFGDEVCDFIVGTNTPEEMRKEAEKLKLKLENPDTQMKIRRLYAENVQLRIELL